MATKKQTALVVNNESQVAGFIQQAIEKGLPVETMEKLFALHKEVKADKAKEAFVMAMSEFQKEVLIGLLLSDGCLERTKNSSGARLKVSQSGNQHENRDTPYIAC